MPTLLKPEDWAIIPNPGVNDAYTDFDLDTIGAPADCIGIIYARWGPKSSANDAYSRCGIRKNGSSDTLYVLRNFSCNNSHDRIDIDIVGCDSNHLVEVYMARSQDFAGWIYVVGWLHSGDAELPTNVGNPSFIDNPTTNTWLSVDYGSIYNGGTVAAWLARQGSDSQTLNVAFRSEGSSVGTTNAERPLYAQRSGGTIFVDSGNNDYVEGHINTLSSFTIVCRGYLKTTTDGYVGLVNRSRLAIPNASSSWQKVTVSDAPAWSWVFVIVSGLATGWCTLRSVDDPTFENSQWDHNGPITMLVQLDGSKQLEVRTENNESSRSHMLVVHGYFPGEPDVLPPIDLTTDDLDGDGAVQGKGVTSTHEVGEDDLNNTGLVQSGAVDINHAVTGDDLNNTGLVQAGAVDTEHAPVADDLGNTGLIEDGSIDTEHFTSAEDTGNSGAVEQDSIDTEHDLSTSSAVPENFITEGEVAYTHAALAEDTDSDGTISEGAVTADLTASPQPLNAVHEIEGPLLQITIGAEPEDILGGGVVEAGEVATEVALGEEDLTQNNWIQSGPAGISHVLGDGEDLTNETFIESGLLSVDPILSPQGMSQEANYVEGVGVATSHNTVATNTDAVSPIESAEVRQQNETTGPFVATPDGTISVQDIWDETDTIAGPDAHNHVNDQSNNTWLRQSDDYRADSYVWFSLFSGIPDDLEVRQVTKLLGTFDCALEDGWVDDPRAFLVQMFQMDGVTALTDELLVCQTPDIPETGWTRFEVSFTVVTGDVEYWTDARARLHWTASKLGQDDQTYLGVSQVYIHGEYLAGSSNYDLKSVGQIEDPKIEQSFALIAEDTEGNGEVEEEQITRTHEPVAENTGNDGEIEEGLAEPNHLMHPMFTGAVGEITSGIIAHQALMYPQNLYSRPNIYDAAIGVDHEVDTLPLTQLNPIEDVLVRLEIGIFPASLDGDGIIPQVAIGYEHPLATTDLDGEAEIPAGRVTQDYIGIIAEDLSSEALIDDAPLDTEHLISSGPVDAVHEIDADRVYIEHFAVGEDAANDGEIEQGRVDTAHHVGPASLESSCLIEEGLVDTAHLLGTTDLEVDNEVEEGRIFIDRNLYVVQLIPDNIIDHVALVEDEQSLIGHGLIEGVPIEQKRDPYRYAPAMIVGA